MITFVSETIKYSAILANCYFAFSKLLPHRLRAIDALFIPLFIAFGLGGYFVNLYCDYLTCVYLVAANLSTVALRYREPAYETITLGIISYGVSVCSFLVALIISTPLNIIVYYFTKNNEINNLIKIIIITILHLTAVVLVFRIKRFQNGLSPKHSKYSFDLLLFMSSACIVAMTLFYANAIKLTTASIIVLCIVVCGLLLLFFWRKHVAASYEENVKGRETEINEKSVEFYERQNEELKKQNDELANVIHRDNKLLAALEADGALSGALRELYRDRKQVLENYRKEDERIPQTGINSLDAVIGYLINRAAGEGITLTFEATNAAALALCGKIYDNLALNTLFCDLGENAILALKGKAGGKILIEIGEEDGLPFATFSDDGAPFPAEIIAEAGLSRVTSRKDDGGSGRGLMSTMEILKHFGATFFLDELVQGDFAKTIKICWGMPKLFVVRSRREYLHAFCSARSDMGCITQADDGQLRYFPPHEEYLRAAADARIGKIGKPRSAPSEPPKDE